MKEISVDGLRKLLKMRGLDPEPFIKTVLGFQTLLNGLNSHDKLEVAEKVIQAMSVSLILKHSKYHKNGGQDERTSSPLN